MAYSFTQLEQFWEQAGGPAAVAPIMAAIGLAESGGQNIKQKGQPYATTGWGIWQITPGNSEPQFGTDEALLNPINNARAAVAKYHSLGLHAWTTYTSGAYLKYMSGHSSSPPNQYPGLVDPVESATFLRIDQGVDYGTVVPTKALASGTIVNIDYNMALGEKVASHALVTEKFDKPIDFQGRTYYGAYYSEEDPLVHKGEHIQAGQNVIKAGENEIGFLAGAGLAFPGGPNYDLKTSPPTQEGTDFASLVKQLGGPDPGAINPYGGIPSAVGGAVGGIFSGIEGGVTGFLMQALFVIIGLGLCLVGLALIAWTVMGRVGAPGIIGMAQTQMRIRQSGARIEESHRASTVRETQASERISLNRESGARAERRLRVSEGNLGRRKERYVVKDKPNQVVRKKQGNPAAGAPRVNRG